MSQPEYDVLAAEVRDLKQRVTYLEQVLGHAPSLDANAATAPSEIQPEPAPGWGETSPTALLPVIGRSLLGLAGAYLLRAVTEAGTFSPRAGVAIGLLYAMLWLVWAARTPAARRLEAALHGLTSVLVLAPLLFEATLHFHAISTGMAGAVLLGFTLFGLAVSWQKDLLIVATFATLCGLGTSAALLIATRDAMPFTFVILAIAAAVEACACLDHWLSERWLAALMADFAVLLATWLVTNSRGLPETYVPITAAALLVAQVALLAIYLASTIVRTLLRGFTFTGFETAQCALAFLLSVGGGLRLSNGDARVAPALAVLALACAAACYVVSFVMLDRDSTRGRNFFTYSAFGLLLALAGSRILLSSPAAAIVWSVLAIACVAAGRFFGRLSLQFHGAIFLAGALTTSGALQQAGAYLVTAAVWPGEAEWAMWTGVAATAICYAAGSLHAGSGPGRWNFQALRLAEAATLSWLVAGLAAGLLTAAYHAAFGEAASHAFCATLRTAVLVAGALVLAWAGGRFDRRELVRLIYPAMLLAGYRMIAVDLHQERKEALFLSLLVYGVALIALPRLSRGRTPVAHE